LWRLKHENVQKALEEKMERVIRSVKMMMGCDHSENVKKTFRKYVVYPEVVVEKKRGGGMV